VRILLSYRVFRQFFKDETANRDIAAKVGIAFFVAPKIRENYFHILVMHKVIMDYFPTIFAGDDHFLRFDPVA